MKVYFDYQIFYLQKFGGISRYFIELSKELRKIEHCQPSLNVLIHQNNYVQDKEIGKFLKSLYKFNPKLSVRIFRLLGRINSLIRFFSLTLKSNIVYHETYYSHCLRKNQKHRVTTIHDMIPELFLSDKDEFKTLIQQKKEAIKNANAIIVVSESTKNDLVKFYPAYKDKIHVIYHGVSTLDINDVPIFESRKPFILYVGNRGNYKNFSVLLSAFINDKSINEAFHLYCFGGGDFKKEEIDSIKSHDLEDSVFQLSGDDSLLNSLYKSAFCFVFPSTYEGFGMPVLEAMAMHCPVICSNTSSLPEVVGDAALLINPLNEKEIIDSIHVLITNPELRDHLVRKGIQHIRKFTWKICAENTYNVYKTLLEV